MADVKNVKSAIRAYNLFCGMLDDRNWKYKPNEDELTIEVYVNGDDMPMAFLVMVDAERQLVMIHSPMPTEFPDDKLIDGAVATCQTNFKLADGCFEFDLGSGRVMFKITTCFDGSVLSKETMEYLLECAMYTVDKYNDKLHALANGEMDINEYFSSI